MQSSRAPQKGDNAQRPKVLHISKSFSRLEPASQSPLSRSRASTLQGPPIPEILYPQNASLLQEGGEEQKGDIFAAEDDEESVDGAMDEADPPGTKLPDTFEELPIEIRSLTERFLESLSAKVHPTPLSIDALSDLFQDFYTRAASHISTHIATLSSRISRDNATPSASSKGTATSKPISKPGSSSSRKGSDILGSEQQMLTASEIFDRKKARQLLELKRVALEEAVERAVCEKVYERIWRHRSTDDEERDQKLRSRTAALSLVGIGLKELLVSTDEISENIRQTTADKESEIREWLSKARSNLEKMNHENYPLGKLQHLTATHKSIVETLSKIFPASSSADEILPTLIYTLITSPPETINVISNLNFIQRFRGSSRVDGEAAYCLVNLEAAISFLETVDLSSLRADEVPGGPEKSTSRPTTPRSEITPMKLGLSPTPNSIAPIIPPVSTISKDTSPGGNSKPSTSPTTRSQRRLSNLIQSQTNRIEAASDAVRESILDSADQALDSINSTLENSFRFLFGRLKEQHSSGDGHIEPVLPKTLEDARKLVGTPPPPNDENGSVSVASSIAEQTDEILDDSSSKQDYNSKVTDLFSGRRPIRDRSVDSTKSGESNSGKRVAFTDKGTTAMKSESTTSTTPPVPAGNAAVESMRNLGNTLNPLNRFANIGMIPRFGRTSSTNTTPTTPMVIDKAKPLSSSSETTASSADLVKEARAVAALDTLRKTTPPIKRFLELKDAKEIRVGEVDELIKDYQRLAAALKQAINS